MSAAPKHNGSQPPEKRGYEWRRRYRRQKTSVFYLPGKYTVALMLLITAALSFVPYLGKLAWIAPFLFLLFERESRFLAFVSAETGLLTFLRSFIVIAMELIQQILLQRAYSSRSDSAIVAALTDTRWATVVNGVNVAYYVIMLLIFILAWSYYAVRIPGLAKLADRFVDQLLPGKRD